jgi:glutamate formiminotransferase/formiminotetrahydrofolate cyclodeaminase
MSIWQIAPAIHQTSTMTQLIECVPNFSEGRNQQIIDQIVATITAVEGVSLLSVEPGASTNRTVVTFVGEPEKVVEAAFQCSKKAKELIDMRKHKGEHPRFGATDVMPLVPVANISMEETAKWARHLGERMGKELGYPIYLYESAASTPARKNLSEVRSGEYEGLEAKLAKPEWKPDFGPASFVPETGATAVGARDFLIAVNFNLNTTSVRRANAIAFDVREAGRVVKQKDPVTGKEEDVRIPGKLKATKGIGWMIEEYGVAQVSMNLTNISVTSLHEAFDAVDESARNRGIRVTGTEIVGLAPLKVFTEAGKHFLRKQQRSMGLPEHELIKIAVKSMGLDDLAPFNPTEKIIEYKLAENAPNGLEELTVKAFTELTASESPAPGGGSVAALLGALAAALGVMVANLSSHKRGWDDRWQFFSDWAENGENLRWVLLSLIEEDTQAFNGVMAAFAMPKATPEEKAARTQAIQAATKVAVEAPLKVMKTTFQLFPLLKAMVELGNPNSITDAGVGANCARSAIYGAYLNVLVNLNGISDEAYVAVIKEEALGILKEAIALEASLMDQVKIALLNS